MMKKFTVILALLVLACLLTILPCRAVTVSPFIIDDIDVLPGESVFRSFAVANETKEEQTYFLHAKNFKPIGEEGQVIIDTENTDIGLASWINFSVDAITLAPGEVRSVEFQVIVPHNTNPGGYYAAIFTSASPLGDIEKGVSLAGNVGVLLLVRVEGDIIEDIRLLEFHTRENKKIYNRPPVYFDYRVENRGTVHAKPQGVIKLAGPVGDEVDANPNNSRSLPSSIRYIEAWWEKGSGDMVKGGFLTELKNEWKNFTIGKYTAKLSLSYGKEGKKITGETSFWVFPWHIAVAALVIFAVIALTIILYSKIIITTARKKDKL